MAETRIGVIGCAGRVGRMLIADIVATEGCALSGGVARPGSPALGQDIGELAGLGRVGIAVGDNPERIRTEAGFAALCGVNPVSASSGRTSRHRLNRSGNRQANNALWVIAMVRLSHDPTTRAYSERQKTEGLSHREIVRCLKRYLARQLYPILLADLATLT